MAGSRPTVTVSHTVHVDRPPRDVFDYTQDYAMRSDWDPSVRLEEVLSEDPRRYRLRIQGVGRLIIEYKLFRRGERTSAAFEPVGSWILAGGGGSWSYEARDGGTDWTQTNTLELRYGPLGRLLAPMLRNSLARSTRSSMSRAKSIMETR